MVPVNDSFAVERERVGVVSMVVASQNLSHDDLVVDGLLPMGYFYTVDEHANPRPVKCTTSAGHTHDK